MSTQTAGVYVRISLDDEGHGLGVARQEKDCRAKALALGWKVAEVYTDNSVSASKTKARPAYTRMLADLEAGVINAVVVYDLDRLTRRPVELEAFIDLTDRLKVSLANVSGDVDLTTASGRMVARIKGAVARQEAERIGERVRRQKQQRAEMGKSHNGGIYRLFGYDRSFIIIEEEAAMLRDAFKRVAAGESTTSICNEWNSKGYLTSAGNPWRRRTLQDMIKRPAYAGLSAYKGKVVGKTEHAAIVDEALWQAAQDMMDSRTAKYQGNPGRNSRVWLLSGIAVCGRCHSPMFGSSSKGGVYRCTKNDGGCGKTRIKAVWLDFIAQYETDKEGQKKPRTKKEKPDHTQALAAIDKRIEALQEAGSRGDLELADLIPMLKAERAKRTDLLRSVEVEQPVWFEDLTERTDAWVNGSVSAKRVIINRYIKHLIVNPSEQPGRRVFDESRVTVVLQNGKQRPAKVASHNRKPGGKTRLMMTFGVSVPSQEPEKE